MMRNILLLLCSFYTAATLAIDDDYEKLSRSNQLATERLKLSNTNVGILKNEVERIKLQESIDSQSSEIIAISSNILFVKQNNVMLSLKVGDKYRGSKIKAFKDDYVLMANGKKYNVY